MQEDKYYLEIESYIKKNEVNKKRRALEANYDTLTNYWQIGKLIVEAQNGSKRAKYGNELIKKWSIEYTKNYGSGYSYANIARFKQFYLAFPILALVERLSWTNIKILLPIKDENKRNFYVNECIKRNLSKQKLLDEIKSKSYERLVNKQEKIDIIAPNKKFSLLDNLKNLIIINVDKNKKIASEKDLEITIISKLSFFFEQLGEGFALVGNQYKIVEDNKNYYIDLLLLNYKLNCFIVVELKLRELKYEDKAQVEFYMKLIDKNVKESFQNKTIGIIISKEQDEYVANFVGSENLIPLTYELRDN